MGNRRDDHLSFDDEENQLLEIPEEEFNMEQLEIEITTWLTYNLYPIIGIDKPENHDKIVNFMFEVLKGNENSHGFGYSDEDFAVAFRLFMEKAPIKKYRNEN